MRRAPLLWLPLLALACAPKASPVQASTAREDAPAPAPADAFDGDWGGTLVLPGASLRLVLHVRGSAATLDSLDQHVEGIAATRVVRENDTLTVEFGRIGASFTGVREGPNLTGAWRQLGGAAPLVLTRDLVPRRARRPQDPELPLPYPTEDLTVEVGPHSLACTLALPDGDGPWPGVVLLTGSGPQDRDESLLGHRPFLVLSDHLAREGVASLRCDDRGYGESTGSFQAATTADFAVDARALAAHLRDRDDIASVGFIGHSEGGMVAPLAAESADFMVLLAPPAVPGDALYLRQIEDIARGSGLAGEALATAVQTHGVIVQDARDGVLLDPKRKSLLRTGLMSIGMTHAQAERQLDQVFSPWFRYFLAYDPGPALEALSVPTLALWGGTDRQVHAEINAEAFRVATADHEDAEARIFPGLNHLFQESESGLPADYEAIDQTLHPDVLQAISAWIAQRR